MELALQILGWSLFAIVVFIALALDALGLFGNWIILGTIVVLWMLTGFAHFGWIGLGILVALAIVGEVLEAVAAGYGAARFGGDKGTIFAAVVGCIVGAILGSPMFLIIGTIAGACAGAFLGAALYEYLQREKRVHEAAWTGFGAALGKVAGMFAKVVVGFAMLLAAALTW